MSKYSAIPPATPPKTLLFADRYKRLFFSMTLSFKILLFSHMTQAFCSGYTDKKYLEKIPGITPLV
jgi:hypothetical protein